MKSMKLKPVALAVALLFLGNAQATDLSPADDTQTVVVTGIRGSLESSIATKRDSNSIVEAVTAEDIGKLPDASIAESIARLPGLAVQRVAGRAESISIRGMSDDFAVTLMNGRELVSTALNRGVEYDQYPSELINSVVVYKTPDATLAAQGLSGTVDLRTLSPLDQAGRSFTVNARGEKNQNGAINAGIKDTGNRLSGSYVDQFADKTIGVAIAFAHLDSPIQEQHFGSWGWDNASWNAPTCNGLGPNTCDITMSQGAEFIGTSTSQVRNSVMATVEFKPSKDIHSQLDLYYSHFDQTVSGRGIMWSDAPAWDGSTISNPTFGTFAGTNTPLVLSGTFSNVQPVEQSNYNTRTDRLFAIGLNNKLKTNGWTLENDISFSQAKREDKTAEIYAGLGPVGTGAGTTLGFSMPGSPMAIPTYTTTVNWADPGVIQLTDPAGWGQNGFVRTPTMSDQLSALKLAASEPLTGLFSKVSFGTDYSDREKKRAEQDYQYLLNSGAGTMQAIAPSLLQTPVSLAYGGMPKILAYNVLQALSTYETAVIDQSQPFAYRRDFTVSEKVINAFGKLDFDHDLGRLALRGNLGLQVIHTNQSSTGTPNNSYSATLTGGTSYTNVLPSLNLVLDMNEYSPDWLIRAGAAKTMARGRLDDMRAGVSGSVSTQTHTWSGDGGNPALKPWLANSFDLATEKYFGKGSYVAFAGFYKQLTNYIYNEQTNYNFSGVPNIGVTPISNIGTISIPTNGQGGKVYGLEQSATIQGALLSHYLDGFGVLGTVSETRSSILANGPAGGDVPLPGLSGQVAAMTLFYEKDGFSVRISDRYRSPFTAQILGPHGDRIDTSIMQESVMDFQTSYAFEEGKYKGLQFLFQITNLNNSAYRERIVGGVNGSMNALTAYNTYGRQLLAGVNYKFN